VPYALAQNPCRSRAATVGGSGTTSAVFGGGGNCCCGAGAGAGTLDPAGAAGATAPHSHWHPQLGQTQHTVHFFIGVSFVAGQISSLFTARTMQWQSFSQQLPLFSQHSLHLPQIGVTGGKQMYLHVQP